MRLTQAFSGRPPYYDRASSGKSQHVATGAIGPHGITQRWLYTVPSGRKAWIETLFVWQQRITAAGTPGIYQTYCAINDTNAQINPLEIDNIQNAANVWDRLGLPSQMMLLAGWSVQSDTSDASVTGTVSYIADAKIVEYDA